jgi:hypothetical protein
MQNSRTWKHAGDRKWSASSRRKASRLASSAAFSAPSSWSRATLSAARLKSVSPKGAKRLSARTSCDRPGRGRRGGPGGPGGRTPAPPRSRPRGARARPAGRREAAGGPRARRGAPHRSARSTATCPRPHRRPSGSRTAATPCRGPISPGVPSATPAAPAAAPARSWRRGGRPLLPLRARGRGFAGRWGPWLRPGIVRDWSRGRGGGALAGTGPRAPGCAGGGAAAGGWRAARGPGRPPIACPPRGVHPRDAASERAPAGAAAGGGARVVGEGRRWGWRARGGREGAAALMSCCRCLPGGCTSSALPCQAPPKPTLFYTSPMGADTDGVCWLQYHSRGGPGGVNRGRAGAARQLKARRGDRRRAPARAGAGGGLRGLPMARVGGGRKCSAGGRGPAARLGYGRAGAAVRRGHCPGAPGGRLEGAPGARRGRAGGGMGRVHGVQPCCESMLCQRARASGQMALLLCRWGGPAAAALARAAEGGAHVGGGAP